MMFAEILLLLKSRVNEINDSVIVNKINNKRNVAKTKNNKQ